MAQEQRPPESVPMKVAVNLVVAFVMLVPFVLVGAGVWLLAQGQFGEKVQAEVIGCDLDIGYKRSAQTCTARWTEDGVERTGPIQGSGEQEVGESITATLRDGELYSRSLALPLVLLGLGLPLMLLPMSWARRRIRGRSVTPTG